MEQKLGGTKAGTDKQSQNIMHPLQHRHYRYCKDH